MVILRIVKGNLRQPRLAVPWRRGSAAGVWRMRLHISYNTLYTQSSPQNHLRLQQPLVCQPQKKHLILLFQTEAWNYILAAHFIARQRTGWPGLLLLAPDCSKQAQKHLPCAPIFTHREPLEQWFSNF